MHETAPQRASTQASRSQRSVATAQDPAVALAAAADPAVLERELGRERALRTDLEAQLFDQKAMYEVATARHAAIWAMVDEQLREAALQVEQARQRQSSAEADVARATTRATDLEAQTAAANEAREQAEQALARAIQAREDAATHHATTLAEAVSRHEAALSEAASRHGSALAEVEAKASRIESALGSANEAREAQAVEIERLVAREQELTSRLAEATTARTGLERQITATRTAIQDADVRVTRERLAASRKAAEREAELDGQLRQERDARAALERTVAESEATSRERQAAHARELDAVRGELDTVRTRLEREATAVASARDAAVDELRQERQARAALERELATSEAARRETRQQLELAIAAATSDLVKCQAELERERTERQDRLSAAEQRVRDLREERGALQRALEAAEADAGELARLRDRLEQAHRMESVGRLASEAAVSCGNLLADVHRNVQQWLVIPNGDAAARARGEAVLDDVTRAAGLLRRLAGYADEQERAPGSADLGTVVRDLEPVLKRVAGQDVEIDLPASMPLDVEVGSERIERLLVNLASYGRERMPDGGRVKIEIGTTVVDGPFTTKHPNVRAGAHALITMTKSRLRGDGHGEADRQPAWRRLKGRLGRTPALDLGTLQGLVGECGGHLWMTVEPDGDMVAKLHLPLLATAVAS